ncbi:hypothetical protein [Aliterella atlantica]|uniref:hypothetical protein n=1 Tax=Aliterella atlantica TaxID=1827278 RepID=UPI00118548C3|nr:hypothetical protein [Aliterella atlantica]
MNRKLSLATLAATSAIASTVLFSAVATAKSPCSLSARRSAIDWAKTPLVAVLTIPGIAIATTLYISGRSHQE